MSGAIGGIFIAWAAGLLLKHFTELHKVEAGYAILFVVCGSSYLVAWVVMHLLAPKFQKVKL
jgi:ACS family hexuronate transporter-like MFS transporter